MADIVIRTIPHAEQRYDTCGDWWFSATGTLQIRISDMGDWKKEALVAVHELAEALLCKARGISEESVTKFDEMFEAARTAGEVPEDAEPGEDRAAPYHRQHMFAYAQELALMVELGVDFNEYADAVEAL